MRLYYINFASHSLKQKLIWQDHEQQPFFLITIVYLQLLENNIFKVSWRSAYRPEKCGTEPRNKHRITVAYPLYTVQTSLSASPVWILCGTRVLPRLTLYHSANILAHSTHIFLWAEDTIMSQGEKEQCPLHAAIHHQTQQGAAKGCPHAQATVPSVSFLGIHFTAASNISQQADINESV